MHGCGRYADAMTTRRSSPPDTAIKVIAGAAVGLGCGVAMRQLTDWQWWIRYPLILVAVFVAALTVEAVLDVRAARRTD